MRSTADLRRRHGAGRLIGPEEQLAARRHGRRRSTSLVHRDRQANAAVIEMQGKTHAPEAGQWSRWTTARFRAVDALASAQHSTSAGSAASICRRSRRTSACTSADQHRPGRPGRADLRAGVLRQRRCRRLGPFYTTGFQEDHKARSNGVFDDDEFLRQATMVLEERLALFDYAIENYDDGLLFFYFSSSDLQSHMFWWDADEKHPDPLRERSARRLRPCQAALPEARRRDRRPATTATAATRRSSS